MAAGTLECGIVILPPEDLAGEIRRWQAGFSPAHVPPYPPHLTVKSQFRCRASRARIEAAVARVCSRTAPFDVTVDGVECFCDASGGVFFVAVLPNQALSALHNDLLRALARLTTLSSSVAPGHEGEAYRPHLTVLRDVQGAEVDGTKARLAGYRPERTFRVDSASMICHYPDQPWQAGIDFPLGSSAGRPAALRGS